MTMTSLTFLLGTNTTETQQTWSSCNGNKSLLWLEDPGDWACLGHQSICPNREKGQAQMLT